MLAYWIVSGFILTIAISELLIIKKENFKAFHVYIFIICVLVLFVFGGIRANRTGIDDPQYREFYMLFLDILKGFGFKAAYLNFRYEPMTYFIAWLVSLFSHQSDIFIFVYCMISVSVNSYFIYKISPLPIISLAVYSSHLFINKDMNQIRFGLSSAFFLGVVYYLTKKDFRGVAINFVLSFISHATAIVSILPIIMSKNRWVFTPLIIILVSIPASYLGSLGFIELISPYLGSVGDRAVGYLNDTIADKQDVLSIGNLKNILIVILITYLLVKNKIESNTAYRNILLVLMCFSLGGALRIFFQDYPSGGRLANYLLHVEPVLIGMTIYQLKNYKKVLGVILTICFISYYLTYNTILSTQSITGYSVSDFFYII